MYKLGFLVQRIKAEVLQGSLETEIVTVCCNSKEVAEGSVFIAVRGMRFDGHSFVTEAVEQGAVAVVALEPVQVPEWVTVLLVEDTRTALAEISAAFYGWPGEHMCLIGITGTKGKTTVSYMIRQILKKAGTRTGLMGTIEIDDGRERISAVNTTGEADVIERHLAVMLSEGIETCIMEVSSQGLKLSRTHGLKFRYAVFTNIGLDHISPTEHENFEEYLRCKSRLFRQAESGFFFSGDPNWERVAEHTNCRKIRYGKVQEDDYRISNIENIYMEDAPAVEFRIAGVEPVMGAETRVRLPIPGGYNAYNALAAIAVCAEMGINPEIFPEAFEEFSVPGRMERVAVAPGVVLYIDYAHNAMSLKNALSLLREYNPHRIICVFGCGGNRSRYRRFEMGEISGKYADLTITTTDNPRYEKPEEILSDIRIGLGKTFGDYVEIIDRREAIAYAIEIAKPGDVILLAGKGHEKYEERMGVFREMEDRTLVKEILEETDGAIRQYYY